MSSHRSPSAVEGDGELIAPGVRVLALRTPTLPPATHTNAFIVGTGEAVLVEPASPYQEEVERLVGAIGRLRSEGVVVKAMLATHHHPDHVGGAVVLGERLGLPLWAHAETAKRLDGIAQVDRIVEHGETIEIDGVDPLELEILHTPGHAPGHLCFVERRSGMMIAGDMVASVGTIVIDPLEGDMAQYLDSLRLMREARASAILPAHGGPIVDVKRCIDHFIGHRLMREGKVVRALSSRREPVDVEDLLPAAYDDAPVAAWPLARMSLEAHLVKLAREGRAERTDAGWRSTATAFPTR